MSSSLSPTPIIVDPSAIVGIPKLWQTALPDEPPPGVIPDFHGSNPNGTIYIVFGIICLVVNTVVVLVRFYTKAVLTHSIGWDDYHRLYFYRRNYPVFVVLSILSSSITLLSSYLVAFVGMGRHGWDVIRTFGEQETYFKLSFLADNDYFAVIGLVKVSMLLLYLRGFLATRRRLRYLVFGLIIYVLVSHFLVILFSLIGTKPLYCVWKDFGTDDEARARLCRIVVDDTEFYFAVNVSTIILDLIILIIPSQMVWRLQVPKQQKIVLFVIMFAGVMYETSLSVVAIGFGTLQSLMYQISVTLASILRLVYTIKYVYYEGYPDSTGPQFRYYMSSLIEMHIAILCICLPTLKAFVKNISPSLLGTMPNQASQLSHTRKRSTLPQPSTFNNAASGRRWPTDSHDEELIGHNFSEVEEDFKDDQIYAMTTIEVRTSKAPSSLGVDNTQLS